MDSAPKYEGIDPDYYLPKRDSPAVNSGMDLSSLGVTLDIAGDVRPRGLRTTAFEGNCDDGSVGVVLAGVKSDAGPAERSCNSFPGEMEVSCDVGSMLC
jgi:hypothetical protein